MPNDYFRFKQFTVKQDKCAMKVCTDACLFGAWVADQIKSFLQKQILDIGAGTGLLSLMIAQQLPNAYIDVIEIDEDAAQQAKENFESSPWQNRLHVYHSSIQKFALHASKKYDIIISNPPFYEHDLKSNDTKRNLALHSSDLKLDELISIAEKLLKDDGKLFVLLPYHRTAALEKILMQHKLYARKIVLVKQHSKSDFFRVMFCISKACGEVFIEEIIISDGNNSYSNMFIKLLAAYYMNL